MLLLHLSDVDEAGWADKMRAALAPYRVVRRGDDFDPKDVRYIFVWKPKPDAFDGLTGLKAVLSLGAGVDALLKHPKLPDAPMVRFVDSDLSQQMSDYVVAHVTMHHRLYTRFRADQAARRWQQLYPPSAPQSTVGIMGMGVLGQSAAAKLRPLGFTLRSWSRTPKAMEGVEGFAGDDQFDEFLSGTDILVNLLPLTPETKGHHLRQATPRPPRRRAGDHQRGTRRPPARGRHRPGAARRYARRRQPRRVRGRASAVRKPALGHRQLLHHAPYRGDFAPG
jgi:glyoxylate/hydroxypyruvate reductase A